MPSSKRQRQKQGRQSRIAAAEAARRRAQSRRRIIGVVAVILVVLVAAAGFSAISGDDDQDVTAGDSSTTSGPAGEPREFVYGEGECAPADGSAERTTEFESAPKQCIDPAKTYTAKVETTKGTFTIALDTENAPGTVNNFVNLARYHYYDGVAFHRIIPEFVVQGGDAVGDPPGTGGPGYEIQDELPADVGEYVEGSVAMANSGPDTNGSQFFVWLGPNPLPGPNYSLFGQVTDGLDVVKKLEAVGTAGEGTPKEDVEITKVTITEA